MMETAPPARLAGRDPSSSIARQVAGAARRRRRRRAAIGIAQIMTVAAMLVCWQLAGTYWLDPFFYSTPTAVWRRLVEWFTVGTPFGSIWEQILATIQVVLVGLVIGGVGGATVGVIVGVSRTLSDFLSPFIRISNTVPSIVMATLFFIWFGLGMGSKVATVVFVVFFAMFFATFRGVQDIDGRMIQDAEVLGVRTLLRITTIMIPGAASSITAGFRSAVGLAWIGAIVAEFIGARRGLGLLVHHAQATFDAAGIIAGAFIITAIAVANDAIVVGASRAAARG